MSESESHVFVCVYVSVSVRVRVGVFAYGVYAEVRAQWVTRRVCVYVRVQCLYMSN